MKRCLTVILLLIFLFMPMQNTKAAGNLNISNSAASAAGFETSFGGVLSQSGYAPNADMPKVRVYNSNVFPGSYGKQLAGLAKKVYNKMQEYYVGKKKTGQLDVSLNIKFDLGQSATGEWNLGDNDEYQEARDEVIYAAQASFDALMYDYPELFWINTLEYEARVGVGATGIGKITALELQPYEVYSGASRENAAFDQAVNKAVDIIKSTYSCATRFEKVKAIHDWLCLNAVYRNSAHAHSAAGIFLKDGHVVCEGYAKAFKILCGKFGIDSVLVVGNAGEAHMWNYVKMEDGKWYAVDTTWDDKESGTPSNLYFLIGSNTVVSGGHFGLSRVVYTNFSGSSNSKNFTYPILNDCSYTRGSTTHDHTWVLSAEHKPTCTKPGVLWYVCNCGVNTFVSQEELGHSYNNKIYVSNNDATVLKDGTKTQLCDNGCGTEGRTLTDVGSKLTPTIKLNAKKLRLEKGQLTGVLKVSNLTKGDFVKSWKSSDTSIVKVSSSGKLKAQKKTGTATVTVTLRSGLQATVKVMVQSQRVKTVKISKVPTRITLKIGEKKELSPMLHPITSIQRITYSSSKEDTAAISSNGVINAKAKGKTKIKVKSGKVTVTIIVTVV